MIGLAFGFIRVIFWEIPKIIVLLLATIVTGIGVRISQFCRWISNRK